MERVPDLFLLSFFIPNSVEHQHRFVYLIYSLDVAQHAHCCPDKNLPLKRVRCCSTCSLMYLTLKGRGVAQHVLCCPNNTNVDKARLAGGLSRPPKKKNSMEGFLTLLLRATQRSPSPPPSKRTKETKPTSNGRNDGEELTSQA